MSLFNTLNHLCPDLQAKFCNDVYKHTRFKVLKFILTSCHENGWQIMSTSSASGDQPSLLQTLSRYSMAFVFPLHKCKSVCSFAPESTKHSAAYICWVNMLEFDGL
jgi:hypothetical protein